MLPFIRKVSAFGPLLIRILLQLLVGQRRSYRPIPSKTTWDIVKQTSLLLDQRANDVSTQVKSSMKSSSNSLSHIAQGSSPVFALCCSDHAVQVRIPSILVSHLLKYLSWCLSFISYIYIMTLIEEGLTQPKRKSQAEEESEAVWIGESFDGFIELYSSVEALFALQVRVPCSLVVGHEVQVPIPSVVVWKNRWKNLSQCWPFMKDM